jgi:hypothetical protein
MILASGLGCELEWAYSGLTVPAISPYRSFVYKQCPFIIHDLEWRSGAIAEVPVSHPGEANSFVNTGLNITHPRPAPHLRR